MTRTLPYRSIIVLAGTVLVAAMSMGPAPAPDVSAQETGTVDGRYIVVLNETAPETQAASRIQASLGLNPIATYSSGLHGFVAEIPESLVSSLEEDPAVLSVEPDSVIRAAIHTNPFQTLPTGIDRVDADVFPGAGIGGGAGPDINGDVAVIDSGIDTTHPELNVVGGAAFLGPFCLNGSYDDDFFHGSHVAGIIAARDNASGVVGVAPGARLWALKVLDANGLGYTSCAVDAFDWVTARRLEFNDGPADGDSGINVQVINASLGGPPSFALCQAVAAAANAGVIVVAAAGNELSNVSGSSPGNCAKAVSTSAYADFDGLPGGLTDQVVSLDDCTEAEDDSFACFSNFGEGVDIAAPGVQVISTVHDGLYAFASGTSMAAPHVAGAMLLYLLQGGYAGPGDGKVVTASLISAGWTKSQGSTCGFTGDPETDHEPLLFLGANCFGDRDGDGLLDQADNCPDWPNATQALPSWNVPTGDTDCDGFSRAHEAHGYYLANARCAATPIQEDEPHSSWPTDNDNNQWTNLTDVVRMASSFNKSAGMPGYDPRFDIDADGVVGIVDLVKFGPFFNESCGDD